LNTAGFLLKKIARFVVETNELFYEKIRANKVKFSEVNKQKKHLISK